MSAEDVDSEVSIVVTRRSQEIVSWRSLVDALNKVRDGPHHFLFERAAVWHVMKIDWKCTQYLVLRWITPTSNLIGFCS